MHRSRGFTLLELIVAVVIFALMSAITYGGLIHVLETRERLEAERETQRGLIMAFMRLEEDLGQARDRPVRDIDGTPLPAFSGQAGDTRALGLPLLEFTRGGRAIIGDTELTGSVAHSDLQRIAYRLTDEGELLRQTWPVLDRAPATEAQDATLLTEVEEIELCFFSAPVTGTQAPPAERCTGTWPPLGQTQPTDTLPRGVEVKITLTGLGEITRLFLING